MSSQCFYGPLYLYCLRALCSPEANARSIFKYLCGVPEQENFKLQQIRNVEKLTGQMLEAKYYDFPRENMDHNLVISRLVRRIMLLQKLRPDTMNTSARSFCTSQLVCKRRFVETSFLLRHLGLYYDKLHLYNAICFVLAVHLSSIPVVSAATSARPFCRGSFGIFAV